MENNDSNQLKKVTGLVMTILEGFGSREMLEELERIGRDCLPDCARGSVPACTCGSKEAQNFSKLLKGEISPQAILR